MGEFRGDENIYTLDNTWVSLRPSSIDMIYRYEPILNFLISTNLAGSSILDFGCGNVGLGSVFSGEYQGIDIQHITSEVPNMRPIKNVHPFDLQAKFDVVCAVDVLEHVLPSDRWEFFNVMKRISNRYLVISFPTDTVGEQMDLEVTTFLSQEGKLPIWLLENLSMKFPDVSETILMAKEHGLTLLKVAHNTNRLMHYLGCIGPSVSGALKLRIMNDVHHANALHLGETALDKYRAVLFLEASS